MEQNARDALAETQDVLIGLRLFLSVVGESAQLKTRVELRDIGQQLENIAKNIESIDLSTTKHPVMRAVS